MSGGHCQYLLPPGTRRYVIHRLLLCGFDMCMDVTNELHFRVGYTHVTHRLPHRSLA